MGGPLRIPLSEISAYANIFELEYAKKHDLLHYVERMDGTYMKWVEEQRPKTSDDTPPPPSR